MVATAKEQLLVRVRRLSEAEAAETLRLLDARQKTLNWRLEDAPMEGEEISAEEEAGIQEDSGGPRRARRRRARLISHQEIKREFGIT